MPDIPTTTSHDLKADWLKPEEYEEWDKFVAKHPLGLVYHTSPWLRMIEKTFRHIKGSFLALRSADYAKIVAGIPIYTVRSWLLGNRIVSIPYASICDPLISSARHLKLMWPTLIDLRKATNSSHIELRSVCATEYIGNISPFTKQNFLHHYLSLDRPLEDIRKSLPYNLRREINQAHRHGLRLIEGKDVDSIHLAYLLFCNTRKRLCLPPLPIKLFESIHQYLNDRLTILFAEKDDSIIASLLALHYKNTTHIEFYGANEKGYETSASHFLHWEAIRCAHQADHGAISFGRSNPQNAGLIGFKRRWKTSEEEITISKIAGNNRMHKSFEGGRYFPISRFVFGKMPHFIRKALAAFIYRHHG